MGNRESLKQLQSQLGLSNQALADEMELSLSCIQKYRCGSLDVPKSVVLALRYMVLDRAIQATA